MKKENTNFTCATDDECFHLYWAVFENNGSRDFMFAIADTQDKRQLEEIFLAQLGDFGYEKQAEQGTLEVKESLVNVTKAVSRGMKIWVVVDSEKTQCKALSKKEAPNELEKRAALGESAEYLKSSILISSFEYQISEREASMIISKTLKNRKKTKKLTSEGVGL